MKHRHRLLLTGALLCGPLLPMTALALDATQARTALRVVGNIGTQNAGEAFHFDMKMIEALPQHSFTTSTPWFPKPMKFTGPLLSDVLAAVKASKATRIKAIAINDYQASIPMTDTVKYPVIVARLIDGKAIPVREKGPLFVVYPFDSSAELRSSVYYERSVWQLKTLEIQ